MPLLDHFHPPLVDQRDWHSFHNSWATEIAADLNTRLPPEYIAEPNVQFHIEIDIAVRDDPAWDGEPGTPATPWQPAAATMTLPFVLETDVAEVRVYRTIAGRELVAAVELASPANKDRPETIAALTTKCAGYLRGGAGVVIVDVVTNKSTNFHNELMAEFGDGAADWDAELYAVAYRAVGSNGSGTLDVWREELAVGRALPEMPLWLRGGPFVRLPLEETYTATCRRLRIANPPRATA
jgi:hypothetical protein